MLTLLQKIKLIVEAQMSAPPELAAVMATKLADELAIKTLNAGDNEMEKVPDEVWDYFRSSSGEVQTFVVSAFCLAVCKTSDLLRGMSIQDIKDSIAAAAEKLGVAATDNKKIETKPPVEGVLQIFKLAKP